MHRARLALLLLTLAGSGCQHDLGSLVAGPSPLPADVVTGDSVTGDGRDPLDRGGDPWEGGPYECPLPPPMVFGEPDPNGWSQTPRPFPSRPVR